VEVPVEKVVTIEKTIEVPVEVIVEKTVEVPVEHIVYVNRIIEVPIERIVEVTVEPTSEVSFNRRKKLNYKIPDAEFRQENLHHLKSK
jgi:hypothetical protein